MYIRTLMLRITPVRLATPTLERLDDVQHRRARRVEGCQSCRILFTCFASIWITSINRPTDLVSLFLDLFSEFQEIDLSGY